MSYDVELVGPYEVPVTVARHAEGGTYVVGGTTDASLNMTYNYSEHFIRVLGEQGLWGLDGQRARDVLGKLTAAIEQLGTQRDRDYWADTPGNAGYALAILRCWAEQHPDAVFRVD